MIKKSEYLEALNIVEEYHTQLKDMTTINKTKINFALHGENYPPRLLRILIGVRHSFGVKFIDDVTNHQFMQINGAGKISWKHFVNIRGY
tara:strand:+ start:58 stop:327 length:270 start_codon:yes stop_codon:yes gene_type:complete